MSQSNADRAMAPGSCSLRAFKAAQIQPVFFVFIKQLILKGECGLRYLLVLSITCLARKFSQCPTYAGGAVCKTTDPLWPTRVSPECAITLAFCSVAQPISNMGSYTQITLVAGPL